MASQQTLQEIPPMKEKKKKARKSPPKSKFQRHMETRIKGWFTKQKEIQDSYLETIKFRIYRFQVFSK